MAVLSNIINSASVIADDTIPDSYALDWYNAFLNDLESAMPTTIESQAIPVLAGAKEFTLPADVLRVLDVYWQPVNDSNWYSVNSYFVRLELNKVELPYAVTTDGNFKMRYKKLFTRATTVGNAVDIPSRAEHLAALFIAAMYKEQQTDYDEADRLWNLYEVRKQRLTNTLAAPQEVLYVNWEGVYNG